MSISATNIEVNKKVNQCDKSWDFYIEEAESQLRDI